MSDVDGKILRVAVSGNSQIDLFYNLRMLVDTLTHEERCGSCDSNACGEMTGLSGLFDYDYQVDDLEKGKTVSILI